MTDESKKTGLSNESSSTVPIVKDTSVSKGKENEQISPPPAKYIELPDQDNVLQPDMNVIYWRHQLLSPYIDEKTKEDIKTKLLNVIDERKMIYTYKAYCIEHCITMNEKKVEEWSEYEKYELQMIEKAETYSKENLGDTEVRDQLMRRANFLAEIGAFDKAIEAYNIAMDKSVGISPKLHISLTKIRLGLANRDLDFVKSEIKKAKNLLEKGGDWERRNKLKIYEGMLLVMSGKLEDASHFLVNGLSTFSATELLDFDKFVFYTVCLAIIAESRENYRSLVIESPEVHKLSTEDESFKNFATSFYEGRFRDGFVSLLSHAEKLKADFYFGQHVRRYLTKLRIRSYKSFLQPFRNVKISTMADRFGVPEKFLEAEVSKFISSGHIPCRIDRLDGVIYSCADQISLAERIIEEGDVLQTKIQKLSRIVFM